ncbi:hypothetical protein SAMN04487844_1247 [Methylobacterium sp. yr596]|nr:hypothetical protein SAMN04487844_1247 [Methylobacterium sp. yr596]
MLQPFEVEYGLVMFDVWLPPLPMVEKLFEPRQPDGEEKVTDTGVLLLTVAVKTLCA